MNLLKFQIVNEQGKPSTFIWVRPEKIAGVIGLTIPGEVVGANNVPVLVSRAGLDLGNKVVPLDKNPEELVKMLEELDD